jgi:hypothetical protein
MDTIKTQKAVKAYCAEYWDAPDLLTVHVSDALRKRIENVMEQMEREEDIWSVNLRIPDDFYRSDEEIEGFQHNARFDVDYITVIGKCVYLFIQSKWNCEHTAEYEITLDNTQLSHEYNEEEDE